MSSLGQLVIELAANTARLQSDLGKAVGIVDRTANRFKTAFKFAGGGLLGAAFVNAAKQAIDFGDQINKASIKAGIGNRAMSELAYAAKLADVDIASLSTAIKKMQVSLSEAGTGAKGPTTALAALGLTIQEVQKRKPEAQFELLADRISKLRDPADRARAAVELFGKAGADLLPLFEQGAAGIAKARAEAEKLGLSFSDDQIKKLSAADDSIKRLDASWKGFAATLTAFVAPALSAVLDMFSGLDTRSADQQIAAIDKMIERASTTGFGPGVDSQKALSGLLAERAKLVGRKELEEIRGAQTGTSGGPQSRGRNSSAIGFAAADAAAKAAEAAEKAREQQAKDESTWADEQLKLNEEFTDELLKQNDERFEREFEAEQENQRIFKEAAEKNAAELEEIRRKDAERLGENAKIFKDAFLNAWDDMVNNGKFKWKELLKYMVAEFARMQIVKLFDKFFGSGTKGAGFIDKVAGGFGSIFGGGRASGGGVQAGKIYEVGERGRELFAPGMSGTIIPNGAGGGGFSPVFHIDARGADIGLAERLPAILSQWGKSVSNSTESRMIERLKRDHYGIA